MTIDQFYEQYCKELRDRHPIRPGQCLYNYLHTVRPELAGEIKGTECDPFYAPDIYDDRYLAAMVFIETNWNR